jgi:hypothetical protein
MLARWSGPTSTRLAVAVVAEDAPGLDAAGVQHSTVANDEAEKVDDLAAGE